MAASNGVAWAQRLCCAPDLSSNARLVGLVLSVHAWRRTSTASRADIAAWAGLSRASTYRALTELQAAGWLAVWPQHRRGCTGLCRGCAPAKQILIMPVDESVDESVDDHAQDARGVSQ